MPAFAGMTTEGYHISIHHDIVLPDHGAPALGLVADEGGGLGRAVADRVDAGGAEPRFDLRRLDRLDRGVRDRGDERRGRPRRWSESPAAPASDGRRRARGS